MYCIVQPCGGKQRDNVVIITRVVLLWMDLFLEQNRILERRSVHPSFLEAARTSPRMPSLSLL
jgi:hypothetical protein